MAYRLLQLHMNKDLLPRFMELIKDPLIIDHWKLDETKERFSYSLLVRSANSQILTDKLQTFLGIDEKHDFVGVEKEDKARIVILPVEVVLPKEKENPTQQPWRKGFGGVNREELYEEISQGATLNPTFLLLVIFSTIVAAIGLLEDNVAVIIGAMVIAPLLGPNLALAMATALGDRALMSKALKTNLSGVGLAFCLSYTLGFVWPYGLESPELLARTYVGFDGVVLALVSGAAGVLSLTAGVSSVLVGVMVAVALLPPTTTFGIMMGAGEFDLAMGALLLLAVNIVCVNLSAKIVFWLKGVQPRSWYEKQKAGRAIKWYILCWAIALLLLALIMIFIGK